MDSRQLIQIIRRSVLSIALFVVFGLLVATAYALVRPPTFVATTEVFVSTSGVNSVSDLSQAGVFSQNIVKSYAQVATSPLVLQEVKEELNLPGTLDDLTNKVSAVAPVDTVVVQINVADTSASQSAQIANAAANRLISVVSVISPSASGGESPVHLTVIKQAMPPSSPSDTSPLVIAALGAALGLVLGSAVAILRSIARVRIHTAQELEKVTALPVLASIPRDRLLQNRDKNRDDANAMSSGRREELRLLRTNLQFVGKPPQVVQITSSVPGEGKSTLTVGLAQVLSDAGQKVLIIDADLRRPKIAEYFNFVGDAAGLSDLLIEAVDFEDAVQLVPNSTVSILAAGTAAPNPTELLGLDAFAKLLESAKSSYDFVLLDTPPVLAVADPAVVAEKVDGVMFVVAYGGPSASQASTALRRLTSVEARVYGVVGSMLRQSRSATYGYTSYVSDPAGR